MGALSFSGIFVAVDERTVLAGSSRWEVVGDLRPFSSHWHFYSVYRLLLSQKGVDNY